MCAALLPAQVDFPDPEAPISITNDNSGICIVFSVDIVFVL
jgi:hypothetical protein